MRAQRVYVLILSEILMTYDDGERHTVGPVGNVKNSGKFFPFESSVTISISMQEDKYPNQDVLYVSLGTFPSS